MVVAGIFRPCMLKGEGFRGRANTLLLLVLLWPGWFLSGTLYHGVFTGVTSWHAHLFAIGGGGRQILFGRN